MLSGTSTNLLGKELGTRDGDVGEIGKRKQVINKAAGSHQRKKNYTDYSGSYLTAQRIRTSAVEWPSEPE